MIYAIAARDIDYYWIQLRPFIQIALDQSIGEYTPGDILEALRKNEMYVLAVVENEKIIGACVYMIRTYPNQKQLFILTLGGRIKEHRNELDDTIGLIAKSVKADVVAAITVPAVAEILKNKYGYTQDLIRVYRRVE